MEKARIHVFVEGRVRGVFFRTFVKRQAAKLGVVGWVRNLEDGRMEMVAQGKKDNLEELIKLTKRGPRLAKVEGVSVVLEDVEEEFDGFKIK